MEENNTTNGYDHTLTLVGVSAALRQNKQETTHGALVSRVNSSSREIAVANSPTIHLTVSKLQGDLSPPSSGGKAIALYGEVWCRIKLLLEPTSVEILHQH